MSGAQDTILLGEALNVTFMPEASVTVANWDPAFLF